MSTFTATLPQTVDMIAAGIKATLAASIEAEAANPRIPRTMINPPPAVRPI